MALHHEHELESEICADLASLGWRYTSPQKDSLSPDDALYDRERALFPPDVLAWVQGTEAWPDLERQYGERALPLLLDRIRTSLDQKGTLDVLHRGIEIPGIKGSLAIAQFRPAMTLNPELEARYRANRLRVIRQVHYSPHNQNCLDLVLFLNGIPVATVELKSDYTQSVEAAVRQYQRDRLPMDPQRRPEPLLQFPGGALVHFALSNSEVRMCTRLQGDESHFLPFNQGSEGPGRSGGAGNPPNPNGIATSYFWQEILQPDSWLEILGRYLVPVRDKRKRLTGVLFPRFHQLDVTRKVVADIREKEPGQRYLVQHSAGSGKTHSIAWTAHLLADLHDADNHKVFDSVIVISDRTVLDDQLQEALAAHERNRGVVAYVTGDQQSKSQELQEALGLGKKIIVCTLQTFPALLKRINQSEAEHQGERPRRYAVIADEAHSSQTDQTAAKLKVVLTQTPEGTLAQEEEDGTEQDQLEQEIAAQMQAKVTPMTYIAFTATPKDKTLQLFGTLPDPSRPQGEDNKPRPFHVYSMRQAIEEGFILDVLRNYLPYELALRLNCSETSWKQVVDPLKASAEVLQWVRLHHTNVRQHVGIVVEHFWRNVRPLLYGQAKAMVVTGSRLEAIRWQIAMQRYIKEKGYDLRTLVAFSGEVVDPEDPRSLERPFTEAHPDLNPNLRGQNIREAFAGPEYSILIVANKFQTGFDEPLLCGMYLHKRLEGVQAVQTLSRLNRAYPGKPCR